jgi:hypothetical protein
MIRIPYTAEGFPTQLGEALKGNHVLEVPYVDVIASAVTVGRPTLSAVLQFGVYSRAEVIYRAFQVLANMRPYAGYLVRSEAYLALDPSEKSAISYYCGLTFAKLFLEVLLGVPFLQHIACYPPGAIFFDGPLRPDLAGLDGEGRSFVVEAKGRSNEAESGLLATAKAQTEAVTSVGGQPPYLGVAVVTEFRGGMAGVHLSDPTGRGDGIEWNISPSQTIRLHYGPWLALLDQSRHLRVTLDGRSFELVVLADLDLAIGIDVRISQLLRKESLAAVEGSPALESVLALLPEHVSHPVPHSFDEWPVSSQRIGRDGILTALGESWLTQ